jgi:hypothetical protein
VQAVLIRVFLISAAVVAALVITVVSWYAINTRIDEYRLHTVQSTFRGLSRSEAYARLHRMGLTPQAWAVWEKDFIPSKGPSPHMIPWPSSGDVEIDFGYAYRAYPIGACGANATAVLVFEGERVAKVSQGLNVFGCM